MPHSRKQPPRVSVCIPVHNGAELLAKALDSVFAQSFRDFEVLVFDDGSSDGSAAVAERYDVQLIVSKNVGVAEARNRMLREAHGDLVALLDHDDLWEPEKLSIQVARLDEADAVLVHADCRYLHDGGRIVERRLRLPSDARSFDHVLPDNKIITSSATFRREQMLRVGGFAPLDRCSDWHGWFMLAPAGRFVHIPEILVDYLVRSSSLANAGFMFHRAQRDLLKDSILPAREHLFAELGSAERSRYTHMLVRDIGIALSSMAKCKEQLGERKEARALHLEAIRTAPDVLRVWTRACRAFL